MMDESQFSWSSVLCILRQSDPGRPQRFISITGSDVSVREMDHLFKLDIDEDKTFFKIEIGIAPGSLWTRISDWNIEDYESILSNDDIMYNLRYMITPNPTYIDEMISNLRGLKINKLIENDTNT